MVMYILKQYYASAIYIRDFCYYKLEKSGPCYTINSANLSAFHYPWDIIFIQRPSDPAFLHKQYNGPCPCEYQHAIRSIQS
jgi:hypothetical protein